jgi:hypothetical protein
VDLRPRPASRLHIMGTCELQAVGFVVLVCGTLVYGWGEEIQEEQLKKLGRQKARERWARVSAVPQDLLLQPSGSAPGSIAPALLHGICLGLGCCVGGAIERLSPAFLAVSDAISRGKLLFDLAQNPLLGLLVKVHV